MKSTKIMLVGIATFLLTWLSLSLLVYLLSDDTTFKQVCSHPAMVITMLCIGWIPAMVVASDIDSKLN